MTDMEPCLTPPSDFKPNIHNITTMWLNTWDESPLNKLHKIIPIGNEPHTHHVNNRRDQSVYNRCRIGHSRRTCEFLLKGEPPPECIPCNCPLTIKHLLIEGAGFNDVRQRFYQVPSVQDRFKTRSDFGLLESSCAVQAFCRAYDCLKHQHVLAVKMASVANGCTGCKPDSSCDGTASVCLYVNNFVSM